MRLLWSLWSLCACAGALQLPSYISPCSYDDPELNSCALTEAKKAITSVVSGDRKYNIPKLEPLLIEELKVDQDSAGSAVGFSFVARNCTMWGLSGVQVLAVRCVQAAISTSRRLCVSSLWLSPQVLDLKRRHIEYDLEFPRLEIQADYTANGRILLLPITGKGTTNITITNAKAVYRFNYTLDKREDGEYMVIADHKLEATVRGRAFIHLDNLFNGEQVLADNINTVLNDNWQDVVRDVGPAIADALGELIKLVLGGMFGVVSMQNAFAGYPRA
ncbi:protein takeout-like isoform X3 [Bacillus rossius redtenbacheri]|uniref:protein takeout-like isoform X2 n=1 Tax=Bacillus rossius redtenbacheri TaxID=93214 RepID=UPI002FDEAE36